MRFCFSPARVSLRCSFHLADGLVLSLSVVWFLLCLVWLSLTGFCPSVAVVFESIAPLTSRAGDIVACLALGPHRPFFSPVLCGLRLTRLTCLTCSKGICRFCGFGVFAWFCGGFVCGLVFLFGLFACFRFVFGFVSCFPLLLARLSSFTDWCTAHRQQFREQKKSYGTYPGGYDQPGDSPKSVKSRR